MLEATPRPHNNTIHPHRKVVFDSDNDVPPWMEIFDGQQWITGATWPDYFMFGDPHENYYRGEVYYDDVKLEVPG